MARVGSDGPHGPLLTTSVVGDVGMFWSEAARQGQKITGALDGEGGGPYLGNPAVELS